MPVYSHSKLAAYENCPQQYKLRYVDRLKVPESGEGVEAFLGSRVHEVLEKLYKDLILSKLNNLDELLQFYHSQWEKNWHENVLIMKKGFTPDNYKYTGKEAITGYYKRHHPFNQSKTLATEMRVSFRIEDYAIQGLIDRLSHTVKGVYEIHDYKISGYVPSQNELDIDRQLSLYLLGIKERFRDAKDIILKWHYLLFDKEMTSTRSDAQLKDIKKQIISLIKTIEKDTSFKPSESRLCDWCEYPQFCPAKKHEIKVQDLPLNIYLTEEGVSLVNKYASFKAQIKELESELELIKEAAIAYARREGLTNVIGSDFVLRITEEKALQFPHAHGEGRDELEQYIRKAGIWDTVSALDINRLRRMVEDEEFDKKIIDNLTKFADIIDKVSVRLVKKREEEE